jgi:3-phosphoshikimate 1-carboxyvinyltransferase
MRQRPIGQLVKALNQLGSDAMCIEKAECPPVLIKANGIRGGKVTIPGDESSQYLSSLLLAGPYAETDVEIEVTGYLVSNPYVEITIDVMRAFGVEVFREGYVFFRVNAGQSYQSRKYVVEADISNASYFWAAAAITGGTVTTDNVDPFSTHQGDIGFLDLMEEMGCLVEREGGRVTVKGRPLSGISVDMSSMPDMVPTLAAVALFAEGKTVIRNVHHLRDKESDRLGAVRTEWERLGGRVEELTDGLVINGGNPLRGTVVNPHDDHRLAMSLAVVGLRLRGVCVENEGCVNKSFPLFWKLWDYL